VNLGNAGIVLRPRALSESVDLALAWSVHVGRGTYLRLAAVVLLPAAVGCWLLRVLAGWEWVAVWFVAAALASFLQAPFTVAAGTMMFERDVTARAVLGRFLRRLHVVLIVWIASQLWLGIGLMLGIIGAAWTWPHVVFTREAALLEGQKVGAAMTRARNFVTRQVGDAMVMLIAQGAVITLFVLTFDQLDAALFDFVLQIGRPFGEIEDGGSLFTLLGVFAAVPYIATIRFLRYVDGRTRRDGWDLQLAFMALRAADDGAHEEAAP
jgi:hypothetical protein